MAADAILINVALILAFVARFLALFWVGEFDIDVAEVGRRAYLGLFNDSLLVYRNWAWLLTLLCLALGYVSGFYTHGRTYRSRYKLLVIAQAITVAYIGFFFMHSFFQLQPFFPRTVLVGGWALSLAFVGGARLVAELLTHAGVIEYSRPGKPSRGEIKRVLVIGGAGYIGSILLRKLLRQGYQVRLLDALIYGEAPIADLLGDRNFELIKGDLRHVHNVVSAIQGMDAVVHLGAIVGDPACALDGNLTVQINTLGTHMIAQVAKGYGVQRFVFASTCSVYGASDELLDERSALNPVSLYARTKIDCERILLAEASDDFAPIIVRFATIHGLSPRPRFDLVVNLLAAQAATEGRITIYGGDQWRPFVHVDDAATAIVKCLEAPLDNVRGQIFNVGSDDENYRIKDIGAIVKELMPNVFVQIAGDDVDKRNYRVSFAKARRELHFVPRFTVRDGIRELEAAIESGRVANFRDPHYSNYEYLKGETELETFGLETFGLLAVEAPVVGAEKEWVPQQ